MARAGDVVDVPMAGRIVFRRTAAETDGKLMEFDFFLPVGHESARAHLHPYQEERFEVITGRVRGRVDDREYAKARGETAVMPRGVRHFWWNDGDEEAHLRVMVTPALRTEEFYETMAGLAVGEEGIPSRLHGAVVMREFRNEFRPELFSDRKRQALVSVLAVIGRLRGYRARPHGSRKDG
jgi:quercetin dioxygenase-like cupin family protein